jgi:alkanesulfonate monooxygenase SsuD/methylene tetrahydromethanopterin reductase-like flavin-dependent oxidoreductase (luciferase family)
VWVASWGSPAGVRRVAASGDGWLASAYNTTPARFEAVLSDLAERSQEIDGRPEPFPNALATTWLFITESPGRADQMITDVLAPMLNRDPDVIRDLALPIGPAEMCAERMNRYARAGAQRIFLWPLTDVVRQLELFRGRVAPFIDSA